MVEWARTLPCTSNLRHTDTTHSKKEEEEERKKNPKLQQSTKGNNHDFIRMKLRGLELFWIPFRQCMIYLP